jgi:hypothetical protein
MGRMRHRKINMSKITLFKHERVGIKLGSFAPELYPVGNQYMLVNFMDHLLNNLMYFVSVLG